MYFKCPTKYKIVNKELINNVFLVCLFVFHRSHVVERLCENKEGSQCGENFSIIPNLNLNKKTNRMKPRECSVCGKVFTRHSSLKRHMSYHTERKPPEYQKYGEKPYRCKECGKAFGYLQFLETHEKNHNREKKYKCEECGKAFHSRASFQAHERIHTGEKPYECKECGEARVSKTHGNTHWKCLIYM